jgi:negative regulator of flagellin synthesis FlgM
MVDPISFGRLGSVEQRKAAAAPKSEATKSTAQDALLSSAQAKPKVSLSKLTALARELSDAGPPVDHARIAQIRQAISLGSYRFDPGAIADAVLLHYDSGKP